ncbi:MAG: EAL domain-containing protein [Pleurocapsa sp. MO_226.B13]|nr:EAL domain-containing protein [Pleurocapsa sp. MO_226.B13]
MAKDNLSFQLPSLEEIIEFNLLTIAPETIVIDAIARMNQPRKSDVSGGLTTNQSFSRSSYLLVLKQSKPIGVLTERDIVKLSATNIDLRTTTVGEVMTKNVITLKQAEFQDVYQIVSILRQHQIRHLPVVDNCGDLVGMISSEGICRTLNSTNLLKLRSVEEVMNSEVLIAFADASILELSQLMAAKRQSCVVIVESNLSSSIPIGIVTERDIVQFQILGLDLANTLAQTVMSTPLVCMKPRDSLLSVQQQMNQLRVRRLVVADESGELRGTIGFQDMLGVFNTSELYGVISTLKQELNQQTRYLQEEIEQRQKTEATLQENQRLLELFVRHAPAAIAMLDRQMRYLVVSDRWIEDYQLEQQNIIGCTHYEIFPEIPQRWRQDHQDCLAGKVEVLKSEEDSFVRVDGRIDWLRWELRPWHDVEGNIGGLLMFSEVITARQQIEQKLFAEKELAQVTLKSIGDAVITTDALGRVKYINPVAEQLTGWESDVAQGMPVKTIFQIVDRLTKKPVASSVDFVLQEKNGQLDSDTLLVARDGREYAIKDSAAPIKDRQGKIIGAVVVFHDATQARNLAREISWQANHDALTGLSNRRKFETQVTAAIADARQHNSQHALCFLDLDRFKIVNDTCGHAAGDELLKQVTSLLKQRIRQTDLFARLGGDEFGLLLHQCPLEIAQKIANQLRQLVRDFRFAWEDRVFQIGVSIGLVAIDSTTEDLASVLTKADAACYAAKERGRNCVHLYRHQDSIVAPQSEERQWIEKLNRAFEDNLFCLYAQKIVSLQDHGDRFNYEILLRLLDKFDNNNGKARLVNPGTFFPTAERYDLMPAIDRWVVTTFLTSYEAYRRSREDRLQPPNNLYTINLSEKSVNSQEFAAFIGEQLNLYSLPPETICFEIAETVAIANFDKVLTLSEQLKKLGCAIALDDFGSGMSSLTYLKNLPVDYLKIDGSLIKNIACDPLSYATVDYINQISRIQGIETIAKLVENDATLQCLKQIGIDYAQGYAIERPQLLNFNCSLD